MNKFKKALPTILTCIGCVGVVVTAVLSGKASVKAHDILEKEREAKGEDLTPKETVKAVGKEYAWTGVSGAATIGCIAVGKAIDAKTITGLTGTLYLGAKKFSDYRKKMIEHYGVSEDRKIMEEVKEDEAKEEEILETICLNDISVDNADKMQRYYDSYINEFFWTTPHRLLEAKCMLNESFQRESILPLTDWHDILCLTHKPELEFLLWDEEEIIENQGYPWITITTEEHFDKDGEPYEAIIFVTRPEEALFTEDGRHLVR